MTQAGCSCIHCRATHEDASKRRWVASLGLVDRSAGKSWVVDATPDFREQLHLLQAMVPECRLTGIALTHAHSGHYAGLIHLGREAWNTDGLPVYASERMAGLLRTNAPWSQLFDVRNIQLHALVPGSAISLSAKLQLTPLTVPHRDESSDTMSYMIAGPSRRLFYCPDIDSWDSWARDLAELAGEMDVALLDGTFFSADELPGRGIAPIARPLVAGTVQRLAGVDCEVRLVHLNHTNPLLEEGWERRWVEQRGIGLGVRGQRWRLD